MIITINSILPDDYGNQYRIIDLIKSGGFGQVFLSERIDDGKIFAIKTMLNVFPSVEEYNAFKNEINMAKSIYSENVIKYVYMHDGSEFDGYPPYIIMEYATQGSLKQLLEKRQKQGMLFSNEELLNMFLQLARGMKVINSVLVHRDIKPDNILIKEDLLKISDFGLAKYLEATTRMVTFKGYGTSMYCAPEVWNGGKNTLQMDIYSMGIVFYELATLNYPYRVENDSYMDAHLYCSVENPLKFNAKLRPNIISIINKMLQKPISKRFSEWQEIINLLNAGNIDNEQNKEIARLVQVTVKFQNETDIAIQKKQGEEERKQKERETHVKKIMSYFEREIISGFTEFAKIFNSQYASGKMVIDASAFKIDQSVNFFSIRMPFYQTFRVAITVLNQEDFQEIVGYETNGGLRFPTARKTAYPTCKGKRVLAWGRVEDNSKYGYNILLLENKEDEYGDWYILYNTNSGINKKPRKEPFAFSDTELPMEIKLIDATHIYCSIIEEYNLKRFQELITKVQLWPV